MSELKRIEEQEQKVDRNKKQYIICWLWGIFSVKVLLIKLMKFIVYLLLKKNAKNIKFIFQQ